LSFRLHQGEPASKGLRRIAAEQLRKAVKRLQDQDRAGIASIHSARKSVKKVRAVLRLVKGEMPKDAYQSQNGLLRDAGRSLATEYSGSCWSLSVCRRRERFTEWVDARSLQVSLICS